MKKLTTIQDARLEIFDQITHLINQESTATRDQKKASMIWAVNDMFPYVNNEASINVTSLQFSCNLGGHVFAYSISLNVGEIRIGIQIPASLKDYPITMADRLDLYEYESEFSPKKLTRTLHSGFLMDHIFNHRFGSIEVTYKALVAESSKDKAILILSDAIARELIHINHGLLHSVAEKGYLVTNSGIFNREEQQIHRVESKRSPKEILEQLNIEAVQLLKIEEFVYFVIAPISDEKIADSVKKINNETKIF